MTTPQTPAPSSADEADEAAALEADEALEAFTEDLTYVAMGVIQGQLSLCSHALRGSDFDLPENWSSPSCEEPEALLARGAMALLETFDELMELRLIVLARQAERDNASAAPAPAAPLGAS